MKHHENEETLRERAALYALGALARDEQGLVAAHLADGCGTCSHEVEEVADVVRALALSAEPVAPAASLRARLLEAARSTPRRPSGFDFVMAGEGDWREIHAGVRIKDLAGSSTAGSYSYLVRMDAGACAPSHPHRGYVEHCYVVTGDLHIAGRHIHAGDFHLAELGSEHHDLQSEKGCLLLIVESRPTSLAEGA